MANKTKKTETTETTELTLEEALEVIDQQKEAIATLSSELEKSNLQKSDTLKVVSFGGKKYKVISAKFRIASGTYTVEELEKNKDLQKELLEIEGQNIITEI